ncbi:MAG: tRNA uridine-5-carboxymethylaminomethyl(34) synthesis GTPase MnmE [Mariprofundaceae bacterium]
MSTIAAIATPAGRGGVGIIRISGNSAVEITRQLCLKEITLTPRHAHFHHWHDKDSLLIDSGVALYFPAPHSYTGEDVIELQAHGSPVILNALLQRIFDLGAGPAEPGEFTRRAVENGKMNLSQAEAVVACIDAATVRAAKQAQRHLQGEFGSRIEGLMHQLTGAVAHVEACLDFPEEDIPVLLFEEIRAQVTQELVLPVDRLLASAAFGERLFDGATVAIIGAPNVGKSSLLNLLSGRDRAIVSETPGTTRDVLEVDFEVDGIPVRLADTAGIRSSDDLIEQEGIRRAEAAADEADVVLFVADSKRSDTWAIEHHVDIKLMNKSDLSDADAPEGFLPVSVKQGVGLDALHSRLAELLGSMDVEEESVMVTHARHRKALTDALDYVERGLSLLGPEEQLDLVALEWRRAWSSLGEILGIGDVEFILDRVFSEFCVGK